METNNFPCEKNEWTINGTTEWNQKVIKKVEKTKKLPKKAFWLSPFINYLYFTFKSWQFFKSIVIIKCNYKVCYNEIK